MTTARTIAKRVCVCIMTAVLIVGLLPLLPEAPNALAEESGIDVLPDDAEGISTLEDVEPDIELDNNEGLASEDGLRLVAQDNPSGTVEENRPEISESKLVQPTWVSDSVGLVSQSNQGNELHDDLSDVLPPLNSILLDPRISADSKMTSGQLVTWDCVWFGSYPQTEITSQDDIYSILQNASWDTNGDASVDGIRYRRMLSQETNKYMYFKYEPIKWRVLSVDKNDALVVADVGLDCKPYNVNSASVTWKTSSIRSWLNGYGSEENQPGIDYTNNSFVKTAFSDAELNAIITTIIKTGDNDCTDSVVLLSESQVWGLSASPFGFSSNAGINDEGRRCKPTDYSKALGLYTSRDSYLTLEDYCYWWVRSEGEASSKTPGVFSAGARDAGGDVQVTRDAVRPALHLNIKEATYAGIVSSSGDEYTGELNFIDGYKGLDSKFGFKNLNLSIPLTYWLKVYEPAKAMYLWAINNFGNPEGMCFGMANSTYSLLTNNPRLDDMRNVTYSEDGSIDSTTIPRRVLDLRSPEENGIESFVKAGENAVPLSDYIRFNHMLQFSKDTCKQREEVKSHSRGSKDLSLNVKEELDCGDGTVLVNMRCTDWGAKWNHTMCVVGYRAEPDYDRIFVDDPLIRDALCQIIIMPDGSWSYDGDRKWFAYNGNSGYPSLNNTNTELTWNTANIKPYVALKSTVPDSSWGWKKWNDIAQTANTIEQSKSAAVFDDGSMLVAVKGNDCYVDCEDAVSVLPIFGQSDELGIPESYSDVFWTTMDAPVAVQNLNSGDSVSVVGDRQVLTAIAGEKTAIACVKRDSGLCTSITTSDNAIVTAEVQDVAEDAGVSTLGVSGAAATGTASLDASGGNCVLDGLRDITLTFKNDDGVTDEKLVPNEEGQALQISVDEEASRIDVVPVPAFRTQSLTLGGAIGVNFYVDLSPLTEEERESCRMSFSVCGREVEDSYDSDHVNAKGYYGFTCPISSVEMADEIAATLSWGDGESVGKVYSVSEYFEAFEEHAGSLEPEMVALVRSLADYGHYVQPMLARTRGWEVGGDHAEISALNEWDGSEADEAEEASAVHEVSCELPDGCGVSLVTQSLVLDSGTDLCLYVTTEDGASVTSAKLSDGTVLSVEAVPDGRWRVTVPAIMAHELGRRWRVEIETSMGAAADVEASALSWVRAALTADAWRNDAVGRDAAASILRYAQAAEAYKALHP